MFSVTEYCVITNRNITMSLNFHDGLPVTLEQMLLAKELRVQNQHAIIQQYHCPIISLTLVIPGPIKQSSAANYLFEQALCAIHLALSEHHLPIIHEQQYHHITGDESIMAIVCTAKQLKQLCISIEQNHSLGRLWDIDVIDPNTNLSVSRHDFDVLPRTCLICNESAKVCSRSRRHSMTEIFTAMDSIVNTYHSIHS